MGTDAQTSWGLFQILPTLYPYTVSTAHSFSGYVSAALNSGKKLRQSPAWFPDSSSLFIM